MDAQLRIYLRANPIGLHERTPVGWRGRHTETKPQLSEPILTRRSCVSETCSRCCLPNQTHAAKGNAWRLRTKVSGTQTQCSLLSRERTYRSWAPYTHRMGNSERAETTYRCGRGTDDERLYHSQSAPKSHGTRSDGICVQGFVPL